MRCCTVEIRNLDSDRRCATLVVRAYRRCKYSELILICRLYTDNDTGCELIWTKVKGCTGTVWRYPVEVALYDLINGIEETILRERWHLDTLCRLIHSVRIEVRTEAYDRSILPGICLHTLEYLLAVLQHAGGLI